jgi:hypothetical protein
MWPFKVEWREYFVTKKFVILSICIAFYYANYVLLNVSVSQSSLGLGTSEEFFFYRVVQNLQNLKHFTSLPPAPNGFAMS